MLQSRKPEGRLTHCFNMGDVDIKSLSKRPMSFTLSKQATISTSSETEGLLVGTMRYFRASDIFGAKVYFKGLRAPGNVFLPNEFQKWSKSVPLIGPKIFFWPINEEVSPGNSSSIRSSCLTLPTGRFS